MASYLPSTCRKARKKRLALLTAYLEDRPVYIFDEWAADQDFEFREFFYYEIIPGLKRRNKTVIVIAMMIVTSTWLTAW